MPTIQNNKETWDRQYDWKDGGDEWSLAWGGVSMQWYGVILPRIRDFLPSDTILEIAPGFGRWSNFLLEHSTNLILVDLAEKCIEACRQRFSKHSQIEYHVNNGRSLAMIEDESIDLIFSFDSLVHAEDDVISDYVKEFARILSKNGVAVIHHSNLGNYPDNTSGEPLHNRADSMTKEKFVEYANQSSLTCISQEVIAWGTASLLIDCFSIVTRPGSRYARENRIVENLEFMNNASYLKFLSGNYNFK